DTYNVLISGIGGTGVVSIGALLGMAAHLEGRGCSVLDQTGLAQKFGAVTSHIRIAHEPDDIQAVRIPADEADLLLGCDQVVAASFDSLAKLDPARSAAVINTHRDMPAAFAGEPDLAFPADAIDSAIRSGTLEARTHFVAATGLATALLGNSIATNLFMVGYAFQAGRLPLSAAALEQAIEMNGVAVEMNTRAFAWGRAAAHDPAAVDAIANPHRSADCLPVTLDELVEHRAALLREYQDRAYARRYRERVEQVRRAEAGVGPGGTALTEAVAVNYFRVLAYKDEYEVARLLTAPAFRDALAAEFEGDYRLHFHLAPPWLSRPNEAGRPRKTEFGPWLGSVLRSVAALRRLRATPLDPFRFSHDRKLDRRELSDFEAALDLIATGLTAQNHGAAVEWAGLASAVRGFGPVKAAAHEQAAARRAELLSAFG
ncbi:MAG: DUF6537 domain-containing protein, partial [Gammaproteobacteria bacterium]